MQTAGCHPSIFCMVDHGGLEPMPEAMGTKQGVTKDKTPAHQMAGGPAYPGNTK